MTISVNNVRHTTRKIADTMNDRQVQRIVEAYLESLRRRHRADDQADTKLERGRK